MTQSCILWLEDRLETIPHLKNVLREKNFHAHYAKTISSFMEELHSFKVGQQTCHLKGIILDVQILGINDLTSLVPGLHSQDGNDVGWLIAKHYLRNLALDHEWHKIPLLMLTVQSLGVSSRPIFSDLEKDFKNNKTGSSVDYIEKNLAADVRLLGEWCDKI